jgi:hypothetical protein
MGPSLRGSATEQVEARPQPETEPRKKGLILTSMLVRGWPGQPFRGPSEPPEARGVFITFGGRFSIGPFGLWWHFFVLQPDIGR